jgi:hypothetical protein
VQIGGSKKRPPPQQRQALPQAQSAPEPEQGDASEPIDPDLEEILR